MRITIDLTEAEAIGFERVVESHSRMVGVKLRQAQVARRVILVAIEEARMPDPPVAPEID